MVKFGDMISYTMVKMFCINLVMICTVMMIKFLEYDMYLKFTGIQVKLDGYASFASSSAFRFGITCPA